MEEKLQPQRETRYTRELIYRSTYKIRCLCQSQAVDQSLKRKKNAQQNQTTFLNRLPSRNETVEYRQL